MDHLPILHAHLKLDTVAHLALIASLVPITGHHISVYGSVSRQHGNLRQYSGQGADAPADFQAIHIGQHQVQNDQVRHTRLE